MEIENKIMMAMEKARMQTLVYSERAERFYNEVKEDERLEAVILYEFYLSRQKTLRYVWLAMNNDSTMLDILAGI